MRCATSTFLSVTGGRITSNATERLTKKNWINEWMNEKGWIWLCATDLRTFMIEGELFCVLFGEKKSKIWRKNAVWFDLFCYFHSLHFDAGNFSGGQDAQKPAVVSKSFLILRSAILMGASRERIRSFNKADPWTPWMFNQDQTMCFKLICCFLKKAFSAYWFASKLETTHERKDFSHKDKYSFQDLRKF